MATIDKRPGRGYRVRWRGPDGRMRSKTFARAADARRFRVEIDAQLQRGTYVDPRLGSAPFGPWAETVLDGRVNLRPASRDRDRSYFRNHVLAAFGDVPVADLRRADVQSWVRDLSAAKGLAPRTVRECYRILSGIMAEAVEERMVAESPCRRVRLPRVERDEPRFLTAEQVEVLADASDDVLRPLVYVDAYMGLRWGEAAGLKRRHLHLFPPRGAHAVIAGTLERDRGTYRYVEETKSSASRRRVPVPAFLVDELAAHLARAPESDFVFCGRDGGHLHYWNVRKRRWHPAVERAGLAPLRFHELRHTAATIMIDEGADVLAVSRRLGHEDVSTTLNLYGHRFPERDEELTVRLDERRARARSGPDVSPVCPGDEGDNVAELRK